MKRLCLAISFFLFILQGFSPAVVISYPEVTSITDTSAVLSWRTDVDGFTKIEYGMAGYTSTVITDESGTKYHQVAVSSLAPNSKYLYRISSAAGSTPVTGSFYTLATPSGTYLFSFATISDPQFAKNAADTSGVRGRPYSSSESILSNMVSDINLRGASFVILKGDIAEAAIAGTGDQINSSMIPTLELLTGTTGFSGDISGSRKYLAIPGNHDKQNSYSAGNWVTKNMTLLTSGVTTSDTLDSSFNYSFDYRGYHFIMLDTVRSSSPYAGHADTNWLASNLAANSSKKTLIFMHHPAGDLSLTIPTETVGGVTIDSTQWQIDNITDFQNVIKTYKAQIGGVFIGHVHDNHYYVSDEATGGVPFVRTSSALQYPQGYDVYKVYSGGYMQTFYKLSDAKFSEYARDRISADSSGNSADYYMQVWSGPVSARNFSYSYPVLSTYEPTVLRTVPSAGASAAATDSKIIIEFSQAMNTDSASSCVTASPSISISSVSWDSSNRIMTCSLAAALSPSTNYTFTVGNTAKDASGTLIAAPYNFSFATTSFSGGSGPLITITPLTNNITIEQAPQFSGTASDTANTVISVECRIDSGIWESALVLDGYFNSSSESFIYKPSSFLAKGLHTLEVRGLNASSIYTTPYASYEFTVTSKAPTFTAKINGVTCANMDMTNTTPLIEISILTASTLDLTKTKMLIDGIEISSVTPTRESATVYKLSHRVAAALSQGKHIVSSEACDTEGDISSFEVSLLVAAASADTEITGPLLNYPNPFDPKTGTYISYNLNKDANIEIIIFSVTGNLICKKSYAASSLGGSAGYNEVFWDAKTSDGQLVGNGLYLYLIASNGKVISKGKMTAVAK